MSERRLGQWQLVRQLGQGGMAQVWEAKRVGQGVGTTVAIKTLRPDKKFDGEIQNMLVQEAKIMAKLHHSNIVHVHDVEWHDGIPYLIMDWVDGLNLAQLGLRMRGEGEPLPPKLAAYVAGEMAKGLSWAHARTDEGKPAAVIHRDVSPQNVLVTPYGEIKLTDFGLARLIDSHSSASAWPVGKAQYCAPELFYGIGKKTVLTDLFALGAVLHELLSGEVFRGGLGEHALYAAGMHCTVKALPDHLPPELVRLCNDLLHPDPRKRPQTAIDVCQRLAEWHGFPSGMVSYELGALVCRYGGMFGARSGAHVAAQSGTTLVPIVTNEATPAPVKHDLPTPMPAAQRDQTDHHAPEPTTTRRRWPIPAATLGLGLVLGGAGVGAAALTRDDDAPTAAPTIETPVDVAAKPMQQPAPEQPAPQPISKPAAPPTITPAIEPEATAPPNPPSSTKPAQTETAPQAKPARRQRPKANTKPAPRPPPANVAVKLRLDCVRLAYLQIDGRSHELAPLVDLELPVGRHRLRWRLSRDDPWQGGGSIRLRPDTDYYIGVRETGPKLTVDDGKPFTPHCRRTSR